MKLMTEYLEGTTEAVVVEENGKKNLYIEGIFMQSAVKNHNGRIYPTPVLESAVNKYIEESVKTNSAIGELNHPTRPNPDPAEACHRIVELRKTGTDFYGKSLVLNTPKGNVLRGLIEGGTRMGVSSRGLGTFKAVNGVNEVQSDFVLKCVDSVLTPSAPAAFVNGIMEGIDFGLNGEMIQEIEDKIHRTPAGKLAETKVAIFLEAMKKVTGFTEAKKRTPKKSKGDSLLAWLRTTQTRPKGVSDQMWNRYQIYLDNTNDKYPKSFDEWLNSTPKKSKGDSLLAWLRTTQTRPKGVSNKMWDRYQIYLASTNDKYPKSFDEWLNS